MPLGWSLSPAQARVLGALLEKESLTPEYYPLSLAALRAACNQTSSREPILELSEDEVRLALRNLHERQLAATVHEGRVPKYRHQLQEAFNLTRGQSALLCVLLLRGPQTLGELRGRSERLHAFAGLDEVEAALRQLAEHDPPLAVALARGAGEREARYAHLLSGAPALGEAPPASEGRASLATRVERLEADVAALRAAVERLGGSGV
jgi:uncharacterized protein YceH (UPF0502 family)